MDNIFIKAKTSNEFISSAVSNLGKLACHGNSFEEFAEAYDMYPLTQSKLFRFKDNFLT